ncbi:MULTISPECIES: lipopolysaccharide core heptose(II) kinase RfaY [Tatumella]|uniref:Lipopolysaccharide core heptose(II) kinase RfaY n=1 Tax=Tatumella punctata TaxID=399969 RepID=A0ABW1VRH4_9GAMM|nr:MULTISPECIES: lipopolysaccharide core heptose(II) kinase RfaY [unclassified Tatumella]MBS0857307.1 lipopolysaccharide biosynthesis protein [Tatumella sp. JGM16]MBS0878679.1 lipopolysaccharide biosynthesis protein [Tatumella sp. JGM82]MBS0892173.1 lipopolysaccharide biosynthesis protein [Tatumella sp. JGM94]MBS0895546.1 lipopolysaccharide biosynthesis protein [Tatumella sp. JGM130]MBS0903272.1 lipopolysaccharide biosynthesis protein [Tatumella sp. JGM100]
MSVHKLKHNGYRIYFSDEGKTFHRLISAMMNNDIQGEYLTSGNALRNVMIFEHESKKFILKRDREVDQRFEKKLSALFSGSFNLKLIKKIDRYKQDVIDITSRLYYVAEKIKFGQCVDSFCVYEYADGYALSDENISDHYEAVASSILSLHQAGLASNDIHPANFICKPDGKLKVIDLSCRGSIKVCQANDRLALKKKYNLDIESGGLIYSLIKTKDSLKYFSRKIRGKV